MTNAKWGQLATLISYPGEGSGSVIGKTVERLIAEDDELAGALAPFARFIRETDESELEEFYTRTFDINPLCCLEVGWQIHGDTYDRGTFLVQMRGLLREHGLPEGTELPDHLSSILPLVPLLTEPAARELRDVFILPAVIRMRRGFVGETGQAAETGQAGESGQAGEKNVYDAALSAIEITLRRETTLSEELLTALERGAIKRPTTASGEAEFGPNGTPLAKEACCGC